ncbi:MAG: primosomal protein N' [Selenomonadaceae bacterium]|nr:primosomal protein N' [Selenomonadaceae bacterium]
MVIAEVCVNVAANSINKNFTYLVPESLKFLTAGWRVIVPFGKVKVDGFVMSVREVDDATKFEFALKKIFDVIDEEPWFTSSMMGAARWMSEFYLCPLSKTMTLFMPGSKCKKISVRYEKFLRLAKKFDEKNFKKAPAQLKLLKLLAEVSELSASELKERKISAKTIKALVEAGFVKVVQRRNFRDSYSKIKPVPKSFELTVEQVAAIEAVKKFLTAGKFKGFLLHGVTSSGKTQVYIELAKITRQLSRRVIILVPEIALTGQAVENFKAHFEDVAVIHSRLSIGERSDTFHKIRNGEVGIVIGARSALFTPIDNVGLIVVDEEQDNSYKQNTKLPYYHARIVAEELAKFHNAAIVFGSATPSLENFYRAEQGELIPLKMPRRVLNNPLPQVECVDMRGELQAGNRSVLSRALIEMLKKTLAEGQQAILLLNRRGWSTVVMCRSCGEVIKCPDCGLPMTYHADGKLRCHHCEIEIIPPRICPKCGSRHIKFLGTGTEKLELMLKNSLPKAKVLRMDRDSTGGKFGHKKILDAFAAHEYDILFGTQMVAKGHDISGVTAVGVLNADAALSFSNFRAAETCFELITQAAGRAGRADLPGKVIVQAYDVNASAIRCGCEQNYEKFYLNEIPNREEIFFPPFCRMVKLIFMHKNEDKAKNFAKEIRDAFKEEIAKNPSGRQEIFGPIPAAIANLRGIYRFVLLIKSENLSAVRKFLQAHNLHKRNDVIIDIDPLNTD